MKRRLWLFIVCLAALSLLAGFAVFPIQIRVGASDPATCSVTSIPGEMQLFINTTSHSLKLCTAANTWTAFGTGSASAGGTNSQTVGYTAVAGDAGKLVSMNGASLTLTLPAAPPSATWWIAVENLNSTNLTIARNGLNIDGAASNLTLYQNQGIYIYTDGSNYFTQRGGSNHFGSSGVLIDSAGGGILTMNYANTASNATITNPLPVGGTGTTTVKLPTIDLTGQTALIASTQLVASSTGHYLVNYHIVQSAACATGAPGAVVLTVSYTDESGAQTQTATLTATNAAGAKATGSFSVWSQAAVVNYSTSYTNCGSGTLTYALHVHPVQD